MTRRGGAAAMLAALLVVLGGCTTTRTGGPAPADETTTTSAGVECRYVKAPDEDAPVGLPPSSGDVDAESAVLTTNHGDLTITLDPDLAPCTVRSFAFLAKEGIYDGSSCHRMTAAADLKVLQCGIPTGGKFLGPGYTIPDELPTHLPAGPPGADGQPTAHYDRGTVAMANYGPDTGGSQFFLVYGDSTLPPSYTVFGTLEPAGLTTVDKIAAGGITPGDLGPEDGAPKLPVTIESAEVR